MTKVTIFGLLVVIETPDKPEEKTAPVRRVPTLDELLSHAFREAVTPDESQKVSGPQPPSGGRP
jgi:hypothetical protein